MSEKVKFGICMSLDRAVEIMDCPPFIAGCFYTVDERRLAFEMVLDAAKQQINPTENVNNFDNVLEFRK